MKIKIYTLSTSAAFLSFSPIQMLFCAFFSAGGQRVVMETAGGRARHMKDLRTSTPSARPPHLSPLISNSGSSPDSLSVPP